MHRRRIYTEEKAKVVAAAWATALFKFLAAIAILHRDDLKNRMSCKIASVARISINSVPQAAVTTFAFSSV